MIAVLSRAGVGGEVSKVLQSSALPLVHVSIIPDSKIFFLTNINIGDCPCTLLIFLDFFLSKVAKIQNLLYCKFIKK